MDGSIPFVEKRNEKGYTLLECLLSLFMCMALISLMPGLFQVIFSTDEQALKHQEVALFFQQADKEIQGSASAAIFGETLYLTQQDERVVTYERIGTRVVRKVDGKGYEIILLDVTSFKAEVKEEMVELRLDMGGRTFMYNSILMLPLMNR
ncbi:competence type IV pilus minor pilin ComGF [Pseudalkalibacillus sp. SCS-8]|uniref:competence type IV pilus minor pilin ComGF n=1 Tax=Pseudalkalibacillus nanhaiensis TaxID=3115291 RepID=UPI0032DBDA19